MRKFLVTGWVSHPITDEDVDMSVVVSDLTKAREELAQRYRDLSQLPESQRCDVTITEVNEIFE